MTSPHSAPFFRLYLKDTKGAPRALGHWVIADGTRENELGEKRGVHYSQTLGRERLKYGAKAPSTGTPGVLLQPGARPPIPEELVTRSFKLRKDTPKTLPEWSSVQHIWTLSNRLKTIVAEYESDAFQYIPFTVQHGDSEDTFWYVFPLRDDRVLDVNAAPGYFDLRANGPELKATGRRKVVLVDRQMLEGRHLVSCVDGLSLVMSANLRDELSASDKKGLDFQPLWFSDAAPENVQPPAPTPAAQPKRGVFARFFGR